MDQVAPALASFLAEFKRVSNAIVDSYFVVDNDRRIVDLAKIEQRPEDAPITIFKSCGLGVEDVAAAAYVYERL